jgi:uncharacterized membrane-anchored protein YitT (DUF2179 family)
VITLAVDFINFEIAVKDNMLAVFSGGTIVGAGAGIIFRSLGSAGGNDIISMILNQKFVIRIGTYYSISNLVLYSMAMSFISSQMIDYFMQLFNERKMIFLISENSKIIADEIIHKMNHGVIYLKGQGVYTGRDKGVILTITNNF